MRADCLLLKPINSNHIKILQKYCYLIFSIQLLFLLFSVVKLFLPKAQQFKLTINMIINSFQIQSSPFNSFGQSHSYTNQKIVLPKKQQIFVFYNKYTKQYLMLNVATLKHFQQGLFAENFQRLTLGQQIETQQQQIESQQQQQIQSQEQYLSNSGNNQNLYKNNSSLKKVIQILENRENEQKLCEKYPSQEIEIISFYMERQKRLKFLAELKLNRNNRKWDYVSKEAIKQWNKSTSTQQQQSITPLQRSSAIKSPQSNRLAQYQSRIGPSAVINLLAQAQDKEQGLLNQSILAKQKGINKRYAEYSINQLEDETFYQIQQYLTQNKQVNSNLLNFNSVKTVNQNEQKPDLIQVLESDLDQINQIEAVKIVESNQSRIEIIEISKQHQAFQQEQICEETQVSEQKQASEQKEVVEQSETCSGFQQKRVQNQNAQICQYLLSKQDKFQLSQQRQLNPYKLEDHTLGCSVQTAELDQIIQKQNQYNQYNEQNRQNRQNQQSQFAELETELTQDWIYNQQFGEEAYFQQLDELLIRYLMDINLQQANKGTLKTLCEKIHNQLNAYNSFNLTHQFAFIGTDENYNWNHICAEAQDFIRGILREIQFYTSQDVVRRYAFVEKMYFNSIQQAVYSKSQEDCFQNAYYESLQKREHTISNQRECELRKNSSEKCFQEEEYQQERQNQQKIRESHKQRDSNLLFILSLLEAIQQIQNEFSILERQDEKKLCSPQQCTNNQLPRPQDIELQIHSTRDPPSSNPCFDICHSQSKGIEQNIKQLLAGNVSKIAEMNNKIELAQKFRVKFSFQHGENQEDQTEQADVVQEEQRQLKSQLIYQGQSQQPMNPVKAKKKVKFE